MRFNEQLNHVRVTVDTDGFNNYYYYCLCMTHRNNTNLETLTLGHLLVRDSGMNQDEHLSVVELDSEHIQASNFFGIKSASDRPVVKRQINLRNFKHEAELLIVDHFNGIENNFGFTKPIGGKSL